MSNFFIGNSPVNSQPARVKGEFVNIDGEKYYRIHHYDTMNPFFISLASDSNHWMYISSTGGLTAGRKNPDQALFPYYTDDKINESAEVTGSKTIFHVQKGETVHLWEPFSDRNQGVYRIERSIAKCTTGNKLIFIEENLDLKLTFSYSWMNSDRFGWVKKSRIECTDNETVGIYLVDGVQNVLPSGIDRLTQNTFSTLVDGYKKTELVESVGLALFRMESILVDRAEPSESLRANTIWSCGLSAQAYLLSSSQLNKLRKGQRVTTELEAKGVRGAYFVASELELQPGESKEWCFVAEVASDSATVNNLIDFIETSSNPSSELMADIQQGTQDLISIVAKADGIQQTADEHGMARHFSNVLFNTMRGGIYSDNYNIHLADFRKHLHGFNKKTAKKYDSFLTSLPETIEYSAFEGLIVQQNDANLYRLFLEYLPLTFSRRHGDPSRPWNLFNISVKDENGDQLLGYQGNWRDIFQNWEALSLSYPAYVNGIIAKFLNATTIDGYNPYKVTNEGIEWEVIEPENPWSNIGYWGDHQIIYLLKLMEVSGKYYPEKLVQWLDKEIFSFANVPYRLKNYAEIVENPKNSIRFDEELHRNIESLSPELGADAKLILAGDEPLLVNLTEKLLATLLAKLSNFIPEAGIWMNTLRPEWNDANNALVGTGASMVTLYYMRRFVLFMDSLMEKASITQVGVSTEISVLFDEINQILEKNASLLAVGFSDEQRRSVTDKLGLAGEKYRNTVYAGLSGTYSDLEISNIRSFLQLVSSFIDQSIEANKRPDGMYHAYNLVIFADKSLKIRHLYEMLEGQVAVLSSGKLDATEAIDLLRSLRNSSLYREDQHSYLLYPNKKLPAFLEKNNIPAEWVNNQSLLQQLVLANDKRIITVDKKGHFHFNAAFNNAEFLKSALRSLSSYTVTENDVLEIEAIYEKMFDHQSFTGRSGTFYKYEGLGCIYWHMVSKLLLAVGENIVNFSRSNNYLVEIAELKQMYQEIKSGIGAHKSPELYGSFPFDPYSHTPTMAGVQQPGMTGQVKEDIISRMMELGVTVSDGLVSFNPQLIDKKDFINSDIPEISFMLCGIPVTYRMDGLSGIDIHYVDSSSEHQSDSILSALQSQLVFNRANKIKKIQVHFQKTISQS